MPARFSPFAPLSLFALPKIRKEARVDELEAGDAMIYLLFHACTRTSTQRWQDMLCATSNLVYDSHGTVAQ